MITSLYDQREDTERREEWARERNSILDMQPTPQCRISRYRSPQLIRYYQQWQKAIEEWKKFQNSFIEGTDELHVFDVYWYDMVTADYQAAKTERRYIHDILRGRGYVYEGMGDWITPEQAAFNDEQNAWEYEQMPVWERRREGTAEKADAMRDER
jgi:hypothetical protein